MGKRPFITLTGNLPDERNIRARISQEIFPRDSARQQRLLPAAASNHRPAAAEHELLN